MPSPTPNVFLYPRNEPGTLGHLDLVEPLRTLPQSVAALVRDLREDEATYRPENGGWSIKEVVGHLADAARIYHQRLYMMSTQTDPVLQPYDPDELVQKHAHASRSFDEMLAEIRNWRGDTVRLLTSLVNWNWARTGQHLEDGRLSIRAIVELMIHHEAEHLDEIRALRVEASRSR